MKTVLITGATGAIGSALVPRFLGETNTRLRLLIRANDEFHLQERMKSLQSFWGDMSAESLNRVEAFRGDVTQPLLGLKESEYRRLGGEVTHIVHCAGNVKLNQTMDAARQCAVDSLQHIVALAQDCRKSGQFCKLDYVSTVGVAGRTQGLIPETPLTHVREFHNTYEAAKAEAEVRLLNEMKQGLPATIHRPSMVVGDSKSGKIIQFQVFYYLSEFLAGRRTWGIVPETGNVKLDIIPVDYVAAAIQIACGREETIGRIFHLCAGPDHALPLSKLTLQLRELMAGFGKPLPRLKKIRPAWLKACIPMASRIATKKTRRALESLPHFLNYLDAAAEFDNSQSNAYFSKFDLTVPGPREHLKNIMDFYLKSKVAKARSGHPEVLAAKETSYANA